jgi:hypothetical protein
MDLVINSCSSSSGVGRVVWINQVAADIAKHSASPVFKCCSWVFNLSGYFSTTPMQGVHRLRPSSSALVALSSLTPPSPVLSPSQLPVTLTSGDIPILLDLVGPRVSSSLYEYDYCTSPMNPETDVCPSSSNWTVGTFGLMPMSRDSLIREPWSSTSATGKRSTLSSVADSLSDSAIDTHTHSLARAPEAECSITNDHSRFTVLRYPSPSNADTLGMVEGFAQAPNPDCNGRHAVRCEDERPALDHSVLIHEPRTSSSHTDFCYLSTSLRLSSGRKVNSSSSCPSSPTSSKDLPIVADNKKSGDVAVDSLPELLRSPNGFRTPRIFRAPTSTHEPQHSQQSFPSSTVWLDNSFIELSIDQEGFRAVQPRFRFTGYSSRRSWDPCGNSSDVMALFRPISRQVFNFHYSALEALPILRRITVNGDEARDYITRQASLGLKANGVYTVRGNEAPSLPATYGNGNLPAKLGWKFEYFVDDRRVDAFGTNIVDGEKILTPLTFSCSPLLLHPFQGKRITVIHIVKKSVATKLVAEKMEPPTSRTPFPLPKPNSQLIPARVLIKPSVLDTHRRTRSHFSSRTKEHDGQPKQGIGCRGNSPDRVLHDVNARVLDPHVRSARRRRASTAGEGDPPCIDVMSPNANTILCHRPSPEYHPARQIIPSSRLVDLLDQETEDTPLPIVLPPPPKDVFGFQPLRPSPRHYQKRMLRS